MRSEHGYIYSQMAADRPLGKISDETTSIDVINSANLPSFRYANLRISMPANLPVSVEESDLWFGPEAAPLRRKK